MATLPPGTGVAIRPTVLRRLAFPPAEEAELLIGVHEAALKGVGSTSTQVVGFSGGDLAWAGALSERHLDVERPAAGDPRQVVAESVGTGERLFEIVRPGELLIDPQRGPLDTVYAGDRPWVVVGRTPSGDVLAVPLNHATNPKWFTPVIARDDMRMPRSTKDAQLELAHLWSLPATVAAVGELSAGVRASISEALRRYF